MERKISRRTVGRDNNFPDDLDPILRRIYSSRKIKSVDELDYSLKNLLSFSLLKNADKAAALLADLLAQDKKILVVADYDADGATACALAIRGLSAMGSTNVQYLVPDRFKHGYGLSPDVAALALDLMPDVIVTVDNGISSVEGVALARASGVDVIITDHHLPGDTIPDATVIVNPNLPDDEFPSKSLAGVGVMFYIIAALRAELRRRDWFTEKNINEPNLASFLDLVALGTVADVVPLDFNNRILVANGLDRIRAGRCIAAIRALFHVANRNHKKITASDLGFAIGPRLNAAGRLTDMSLGIDCLISNDDDEAFEIAKQLDALNKERREIQGEMHRQALTEINRTELSDTEKLSHGLCLSNDDWHSGVIGILASKIKDKIHRPVIAFAHDEDGMLRGSARSVSGIHIRDVINRIATLSPGLIVTFGGHAMAAGLTLRATDLDQFSQKFYQEIQNQTEIYGINSEIMSDGELSAQDMTLEMAELIRGSGPWGQGFPEPVFDGIFEIMEKRIVGNHHLKMKLKMTGSVKQIDAIAFNETDQAWPDDIRSVQAVYKLDVNEYMGRKTPQMIIEYIQPNLASG